MVVERNSGAVEDLVHKKPPVPCLGFGGGWANRAVVRRHRGSKRPCCTSGNKFQPFDLGLMNGASEPTKLKSHRSLALLSLVSTDGSNPRRWNSARTPKPWNQPTLLEGRDHQIVSIPLVPPGQRGRRMLPHEQPVTRSHPSPEPRRNLDQAVAQHNIWLEILKLRLQQLENPTVADRPWDRDQTHHPSPAESQSFRRMEAMLAGPGKLQRLVIDMELFRLVA